MVSNTSRNTDMHSRLMKMPNTALYFKAGLAALSMLMALAGCKQSNTYVPPPPPPVVVSHPVMGAVTPYLTFTGNTQAYKTVELKARVEGFLEKVLFREGDIVKEGQLLFQIQHDTYEAKLQQAEAQVLADKAKLQHAETELARFSGLLRENAAPQTEVDRWRFERDSARAGQLSSEADVKLAKLNLSYTRVTAPFNGIAGRRLSDPGNLVGAGEKTVLAEINQVDPLYAYFTISEHDLLKVGQRPMDADSRNGRVPQIPIYMGLANEEGHPHKGTLDFAGIRVDNTTGTLLLRAIFPNPDYKIMPGLYARLRAAVAMPVSELLVPEDVIGFDQQGSYVLVVDEQNIVQRRSVTQGTHNGKSVAITDGITENDWVVVNGLLSAIPGKPVTPKRETLTETGNHPVPTVTTHTGAGTP
jgi:RND family efflux transporter MFP subunit